MLDIRAVGPPQHPEFAEFECQLRISEVQQNTMATATCDIVVEEDAPWLRQIERFTIPEIKARIQENGHSQLIRGKTRRADLMEVLRASERQRRPAPTRVEASAGQTGLVVKPLHVDSEGQQRIGISFRGGHTTNVLPASVQLGQPVKTNGEEPIGEGSTFEVKGGAITFSKFMGGSEQEYFMYSPKPVPAEPGVLVPWRKAFNVQGCREPRKEP